MERKGESSDSQRLIKFVTFRTSLNKQARNICQQGYLSTKRKIGAHKARVSNQVKYLVNIFSNSAFTTNNFMTKVSVFKLINNVLENTEVFHNHVIAQWVRNTRNFEYHSVKYAC